MSLTQTDIDTGHPRLSLALRSAVINQFNRLYICERSRWIEQLSSGGYVEHNVAKKGRPLSDFELKRHLAGRQVVGVFHRGQSKVLALDLDFHTEHIPLRQAMAKNLITWIEERLGPSSCHIWDTGMKGYRIEIFFKEFVPWGNLAAFVQLLRQAPLREEDPTESNYTWGDNPWLTIETRPESKAGGRGVKLPLGYDRRNGKFCAFLDPVTLQPVPNSFLYLLDIEPNEADRLLKLTANLVQQAPQQVELTSATMTASDVIPAKRGADLLAHCESLWNDGIQIKGTRHSALVILAMWLVWRFPDRSPETIEEYLVAWMRRELKERPHLIDHDEKHCIYDARKAARYAATARVSFALLLNRRPHLTQADQIAINQIASQDQKLVYAALTLHAKLFANANGHFHCAYSQIAEMLGWMTYDSGDALPNKSRVGRAVRALLTQYPHLIQKVQEPELTFAPGRSYRRATLYRLMQTPKNTTTSVPWPTQLDQGSVNLETLVNTLSKLNQLQTTRPQPCTPSKTMKRLHLNRPVHLKTSPPLYVPLSYFSLVLLAGERECRNGGVSSLRSVVAKRDERPP